MSAVYRARVGPHLQVTGELGWHDRGPDGRDLQLESRVRSGMRSLLGVAAGVRRDATTPCNRLRLTYRRDGSSELRFLPGDPGDARLPVAEVCRRATTLL